MAWAQYDTVFWWAPPDISRTLGDQPLILELVAGEADITVEMTRPGDPNGLITRYPIASQRVSLVSFTEEELLGVSVEHPTGSKSILLRADGPFTATYRLAATQYQESYVLKGTQGLGHQFTVPGQIEYSIDPSPPSDAATALDIVATEDFTVVQVVPNFSPIEGAEVGDTLVVALHRGQTYRVRGPERSNPNALGGSQVLSSRPVAITYTMEGIDYLHRSVILGDQLYPDNLADTDHFSGLTTENNETIDINQITSLQDSTEAASSKLGFGVFQGLFARGDSWSIPTTREIIRANAPVISMQVVEQETMDLSASIVPAITCNGARGIPLYRSQLGSFVLALAAEQSAVDGFRFNGDSTVIRAEDFNPIENTPYASAYIDLSAVGTFPRQVYWLENTQGSFQVGLLEEGENVQFFQHYSTQASLNLGGDFALCENETRTIQPYVRGEGLTYRWSDGTTEPTLEVSAPGNYWVEVTNSFGCVLRDAVTVTGLASPPQVALPDTLIYCEGTPLTVQAPDKYLGYRWNEGAGKDSTFTVTDTGYVRLDVLNKAGCTATDSVYVGLRLPPVLDLGRDTALCPGDTLRLDAAVGEPASYLWNTGSADSSLLVVDSTGTYEVQVAVDNCVLQDAVEVLYYPKLPEPILTGSGVVCPGVVGVPYGIANREGSTYAWEVQGGAFQIPSGPDTLILVDWGASNSSASVAVQETTENGCVVEKARLPVRIQVALEPDTPRGEALVCANDSVQVYTTSFTPGSVYNWQLAEGGRILAGQGTSEVTVLWEQEGQWPLWVGESSITVDTVCDGASDTLRVAVYRDSATLDLAYVTRLGPESQGVEISIRSTNMPDTTILRLFRRPSGGPWQQVLEPGSQTGLLVDAPGLVPPVWEYESRQLNGCNQWVRSPTHTTLAMAQDTATSLATSTQLYWNPYREWPGGVVRYLLYRQLDQEPTYQLYTEIPGSDTAYLYSAGAEGFLHRFYVVAEGAVPQQRSLSLGVTATFENPLRFPTVFTPNADGFNDTYVIDNAPLYTPNSLTVVNRHGEVVFSQTDYDNTWNGGNLPEGVYYFLFESPGTNQPVKGVITLLR